MKIFVHEFVYGSGVTFKIKASNDTELALLQACVTEDLLQDNTDNEFTLTLPVNNG